MSCCMAMFSVFIMSLYSSNLVNFFYYQTVQSAFDTLTSASIVIHPAYKNIISYEDLGVYKGSDRDFTSIYMIPYGIYSPDVIPVVPNTWGGSIKNSTTRLNMVGFYKSAYQLLYTQVASPDFISYINAYVNKQVNEYNMITAVSIDTNLNENQDLPAPVLTLYNTWGIFVILLVGYVLSLFFRIAWTKKTGLDKIVFFKREDFIDLFTSDKISSIRDNSSITNTGIRSGEKSSSTKPNNGNKSPGFMELNV